MAGITLDECKLISSLEYMDLKDPQFIGQTRMSKSGEYWMCFEDDGIKYKVKHKSLYYTKHG